jgi:hypothetical protein
VFFIFISLNLKRFFSIDMEGVKILPFANLTEFYREYMSEEDSTAYENPQHSPFASESTFMSVYKHQFKDKLRCMRCKGNHTTCFVCMNAAIILSQGKRSISSGKKGIIVEYRRRHLTTQEEERAEYDRISQKCRHDHDPITGAPLYFQVLSIFA